MKKTIILITMLSVFCLSVNALGNGMSGGVYKRILIEYKALITEYRTFSDSVNIRLLEKIAEDNSNSRNEFRSLLTEYKNFFSSADQTSVCAIKTVGRGLELKDYYFEIIDNSEEYDDSFFLKFFLKDGDLDFTTLAAYEGYNGYQLGRLEVSEDNNFKIYKHNFNGYILDVITLKINKKDNGIMLNFQKIFRGSVVQDVQCSPTIGI